jgi:hypothetical protein
MSILMSMDRTTDHELQIRFFDTDLEGPMGSVVFEHAIAPKDQPDFLRSVANFVGINLSEVAQDLVRGDCPTCRNMRLVEAPAPGGKTQNINCPECRKPGQGAPFEHYPIVGGGMAPRSDDG